MKHEQPRGGRYRELLIEAFQIGVRASSAHGRLEGLLPRTPVRGRTIVLGAGKAAGEMAAVADAALRGEVSGLVVTRYGHGPRVVPPRIRVVEASHPVPDDASFDATAAIIALATSAGPDDRVIFLGSGGGSALLSYPAEGMSRDDKRAVHLALVRSGLPISDINLVRTHLSRVKGGGLAAAVQPAELYTFLISDVVGDDPAMIASGPTIARPNQSDRVRALLETAGISISAGINAALTARRELTAVPHPIKIVASAKDALDAVDAFLTGRGWTTVRLGDDTEGDAAEVGAQHAAAALAYGEQGLGKVALISGGELTVRVKNPRGRGGPNLEYLTALLIALDGADGIEALAGDTDGVDGTEDNAGGYLAPGIAAAHPLQPATMLAENRSYDLFAALGGLVITGPTRTNVNDIRIILVDSDKIHRRSELDTRAVDILKRNDRGGYTVPTDGLYPHQWNWDSAFVALGFATFDMDRAIRELETLFEAQWANGMVPQIAFRFDDPRYFPGPAVWQTHVQPASSGITQPPVAASVAWRLWRSATDDAHKQRLQALFPKLLRWLRWFRLDRDPEQRGIVVMVHPWESGRDNSPEWDAPAGRIDVSGVEPYERRDLDHADAEMRPRKEDYDRYMALVQYGRTHGWDQRKIATEGPLRVADVGLSFMLLKAERDMAEWSAALGQDEIRAELLTSIGRAETGVQLLWDPVVESFCSRDLITGHASQFVTSASFLALYAGVATEAQLVALLRHWDRWAGVVQYMVPSFDPEHESFDAHRYWRGPCWAVVNFMISQGLCDYGHHDRADRVRKDTQALIEKAGFYEAFSPVDGCGTGGTDFSWTAAIWLAWVAGPGT